MIIKLLRFVGDEIMEKPVEVVEEVPRGQNINRKNPLQVCKRISDAEKSAIELLAARLTCCFSDMKFTNYFTM